LLPEATIAFAPKPLVYLIRALRDTDRDLQGRLIQQLNLRTIRYARRFPSGIDPVTAESILLDVEQRIIEALLRRSRHGRVNSWKSRFDRGETRRHAEPYARSRTYLPLQANGHIGGRRRCAGAVPR